jgi:hypothetical protein
VTAHCATTGCISDKVSIWCCSQDELKSLPRQYGHSERRFASAGWGTACFGAGFEVDMETLRPSEKAHSWEKLLGGKIHHIDQFYSSKILLKMQIQKVVSSGKVLQQKKVGRSIQI